MYDNCECSNCEDNFMNYMPEMVKVGEIAPEFHEIDAYQKGDYHKKSLTDYEGKWLVLFFYPRDFTFICPTELEEFGKMYHEFQKLNCEVLAGSTDSKECHKAWFETDARLQNIEYPILADTTHEVASMYGILDENGAAQRGTFVIDPEGILRFMLVSADSVGRNTKEMLRVVEALQTGERCPANWEKGKLTLGKAN